MHLLHLTNLTQLSLKQNKIVEIGELDVLKGLKNLAELELEYCPVFYDKKRLSLFSILPTLIILDGFDSEGNQL